MEQLFSIDEAARKLGGISKWTLQSWLSQGRIKRTKVGRRTMIRESELEKLVVDEVGIVES
jgi:excisionase family DNA binding protein